MAVKPKASKTGGKKKTGNSLPFADKLVLNQWIMSLLGVDTFAEHQDGQRRVRPMQLLAKQLRDCKEGLDSGNLHYFYQQLKTHWQPTATLSLDALLGYEQNIVSHTLWLNEGRDRPIEWKYYQWLSLLFAEIYLHQYFTDRERLLEQLNDYVRHFNEYWQAREFNTGISEYSREELNKLCLQNATGSGKTLVMHINYRQFAHYAKEAGKHDLVTRTLLITPNEGLSSQHEQELKQSGIEVSRLVLDNNDIGSTVDMYASGYGHLSRVDFIEITKLGDQNLILVDEGHRGMGKSEEEGWMKQRERLVEKGFAFEYSATFKEAVKAANNAKIEESYAKEVLFDYSYRYFYEDGYGKDYRIFNIPKAQTDHEFLYLSACLLSFYQQLRLYRERKLHYAVYNLEKPLWVFVGSSVSKASATSGSDQESSSPINLLIGAKKFVEGWDCWRVSTLGLMRVGRSEGSQIIQLFGRGVRLKGYEWSLKRSRAAIRFMGCIETMVEALI